MQTNYEQTNHEIEITTFFKKWYEHPDWNWDEDYIWDRDFIDEENNRLRDADGQTLKDRYKKLLDLNFQHSVILTDEAIQQYITNGEITEYNKTRMFLHAIVIKPQDWTPLFTDEFKKTLDSIDNSLALKNEQPENKYESLLSNQLHYLYQTRLSIQSNHELERSKLPKCLLILPKNIQTVEEWVWCLTLLTKEQQQAIYTELKDNLVQLFVPYICCLSDQRIDFCLLDEILNSIPKTEYEHFFCTLGLKTIANSWPRKVEIHDLDYYNDNLLTLLGKIPDHLHDDLLNNLVETIDNIPYLEQILPFIPKTIRDKFIEKVSNNTQLLSCLDINSLVNILTQISDETGNVFLKKIPINTIQTLLKKEFVEKSKYHLRYRVYEKQLDQLMAFVLTLDDKVIQNMVSVPPTPVFPRRKTVEQIKNQSISVPKKNHEPIISFLNCLPVELYETFIKKLNSSSYFINILDDISLFEIQNRYSDDFLSQDRRDTLIPILRKYKLLRQSELEFKQSREATHKLINQLHEEHKIGDKERQDLTKQVSNLSEDPNTHSVFVDTAKQYESVAGGKLSAYMMRVYGWLLKMIGLHEAGADWITQADEKLKQIEITEQMIESNQSRVTNPKVKTLFQTNTNSKQDEDEDHQSQSKCEYT